MTWYRKLPKIELHVHLEGAIPPGALLVLIQKYGGDSSISDVAALAKRFEYKNFAQFLEARQFLTVFRFKFLGRRQPRRQEGCYVPVSSHHVPSGAVDRLGYG